MNNHDLIQTNETNSNSMGGTELLQHRLYDGSVPRELLEQFQIVFSRVRDLDESKFRIFYAHDLPGDPESEFLKNGGWNKFHMLVFVSNWQMQAYIAAYQIPWSKCFVIPNSINKIEVEENNNGPVKYSRRSDKKIKLIYTSTPHRGLNIVYPVFEALCKKYDNIELDVFSSFKLYGWEQRDSEYEDLFDKLRSHPKINYYGSQSNDVVRDHVALADIFAYPSIWPETSCLCLIEAMSAGLLCVHPNFAALPETAGGWTNMYQWNEDVNAHANIFYSALDASIDLYQNEMKTLRYHLSSQRSYTDMVFSWSRRSQDWTALLKSIVSRNPDKSIPKTAEMFSYSAR